MSEKDDESVYTEDDLIEIESITKLFETNNNNAPSISTEASSFNSSQSSFYKDINEIVNDQREALDSNWREKKKNPFIKLNNNLLIQLVEQDLFPPEFSEVASDISFYDQENSVRIDGYTLVNSFPLRCTKNNFKEYEDCFTNFAIESFIRHQRNFKHLLKHRFMDHEITSEIDKSKIFSPDFVVFDKKNNTRILYEFKTGLGDFKVGLKDRNLLTYQTHFPKSKIYYIYLKLDERFPNLMKMGFRETKLYRLILAEISEFKKNNKSWLKDFRSNFKINKHVDESGVIYDTEKEMLDYFPFKPMFTLLETAKHLIPEETLKEITNIGEKVKDLKEMTDNKKLIENCEKLEKMLEAKKEKVSEITNEAFDIIIDSNSYIKNENLTKETDKMLRNILTKLAFNEPINDQDQIVLNSLETDEVTLKEILRVEQMQEQNRTEINILNEELKNLGLEPMDLNEKSVTSKINEIVFQFSDLESRKQESNLKRLKTFMDTRDAFTEKRATTIRNAVNDNLMLYKQFQNYTSLMDLYNGVFLEKNVIPIGDLADLTMPEMKIPTISFKTALDRNKNKEKNKTKGKRGDRSTLILQYLTGFEPITKEDEKELCIGGEWESNREWQQLFKLNYISSDVQKEMKPLNVALGLLHSEKSDLSISNIAERFKISATSQKDLNEKLRNMRSEVLSNFRDKFIPENEGIDKFRVGPRAMPHILKGELTEKYHIGSPKKCTLTEWDSQYNQEEDDSFVYADEYELEDYNEVLKHVKDIKTPEMNIFEATSYNKSLNLLNSLAQKSIDEIRNFMEKDRMFRHMRMTQMLFKDIASHVSSQDVKHGSVNDFKVKRSEQTGCLFGISMHPNQDVSGLLVLINKLNKKQFDHLNRFKHIISFELIKESNGFYFILMEPTRLNKKWVDQYDSTIGSYICNQALYYSETGSFIKDNLWKSLYFHYNRQLVKVVEAGYNLGMRAWADLSFGKITGARKWNDLKCRDVRVGTIYKNIMDRYRKFVEEMELFKTSKRVPLTKGLMFNFYMDNMQTLLFSNYTKNCFLKDDGIDNVKFAGDFFDTNLKQQNSWENNPFNSIKNPDALTNNIFDYYNMLYTEPYSWNPVTYCRDFIFRSTMENHNAIKGNIKGDFLSQCLTQNALDLSKASKVNVPDFYEITKDVTGKYPGLNSYHLSDSVLYDCELLRRNRRDFEDFFIKSMSLQVNEQPSLLKLAIFDFFEYPAHVILTPHNKIQHGWGKREFFMQTINGRNFNSIMDFGLRPYLAASRFDMITTSGDEKFIDISDRTREIRLYDIGGIGLISSGDQTKYGDCYPLEAMNHGLASLFFCGFLNESDYLFSSSCLNSMWGRYHIMPASTQRALDMFLERKNKDFEKLHLKQAEYFDYKQGEKVSFLFKLDKFNLSYLGKENCFSKAIKENYGFRKFLGFALGVMNILGTCLTVLHLKYAEDAVLSHSREILLLSKAHSDDSIQGVKSVSIKSEEFGKINIVNSLIAKRACTQTFVDFKNKTIRYQLDDIKWNRTIEFLLYVIKLSNYTDFHLIKNNKNFNLQNQQIENIMFLVFMYIFGEYQLNENFALKLELIKDVELFMDKFKINTDFNNSETKLELTVKKIEEENDKFLEELDIILDKNIYYIDNMEKVTQSFMIKEVTFNKDGNLVLLGKPPNLVRFHMENLKVISKIFIINSIMSCKMTGQTPSLFKWFFGPIGEVLQVCYNEGNATIPLIRFTTAIFKELPGLSYSTDLVNACFRIYPLMKFGMHMDGIYMILYICNLLTRWKYGINENSIDLTIPTTWFGGYFAHVPDLLKFGSAADFIRLLTLAQENNIVKRRIQLSMMTSEMYNNDIELPTDENLYLQLDEEGKMKSEEVFDENKPAFAIRPADPGELLGNTLFDFVLCYTQHIKTLKSFNNIIEFYDKYITKDILPKGIPEFEEWYKSIEIDMQKIDKNEFKNLKNEKISLLKELYYKLSPVMLYGLMDLNHVIIKNLHKYLTRSFQTTFIRVPLGVKLIAQLGLLGRHLYNPVSTKFTTNKKETVTISEVCADWEILAKSEIELPKSNIDMYELHRRLYSDGIEFYKNNSYALNIYEKDDKVEAEYDKLGFSLHRAVPLSFNLHKKPKTIVALLQESKLGDIPLESTYLYRVNPQIIHDPYFRDTFDTISSLFSDLKISSKTLSQNSQVLIRLLETPSTSLVIKGAGLNPIENILKYRFTRYSSAEFSNDVNNNEIMEKVSKSTNWNLFSYGFAKTFILKHLFGLKENIDAIEIKGKNIKTSIQEYINLILSESRLIDKLEIFSIFSLINISPEKFNAKTITKTENEDIQDIIKTFYYKYWNSKKPPVLDLTKDIKISNNNNESSSKEFTANSTLEIRVFNKKELLPLSFIKINKCLLLLMFNKIVIICSIAETEKLIVFRTEMTSSEFSLMMSFGLFMEFRKNFYSFLRDQSSVIAKGNGDYSYTKQKIWNRTKGGSAIYDINFEFSIKQFLYKPESTDNLTFKRGILFHKFKKAYFSNLSPIIIPRKSFLANYTTAFKNEYKSIKGDISVNFGSKRVYDKDITNENKTLLIENLTDDQTEQLINIGKRLKNFYEKVESEVEKDKIFSLFKLEKFLTPWNFNIQNERIGLYNEKGVNIIRDSINNLNNLLKTKFTQNFFSFVRERFETPILLFKFLIEVLDSFKTEISQNEEITIKINKTSFLTPALYKILVNYFDTPFKVRVFSSSIPLHTLDNNNNNNNIIFEKEVLEEGTKENFNKFEDKLFVSLEKMYLIFDNQNQDLINSVKEESFITVSFILVVFSIISIKVGVPIQLISSKWLKTIEIDVGFEITTSGLIGTLIKSVQTGDSIGSLWCILINSEIMDEEGLKLFDEYFLSNLFIFDTNSPYKTMKLFINNFTMKNILSPKSGYNHVFLSPRKGLRNINSSSVLVEEIIKTISFDSNFAKLLIEINQLGVGFIFKGDTIRNMFFDSDTLKNLEFLTSF